MSWTNSILLLKVTFFAHRCKQRYIEKYAVTSIVTLDCNGKFDRHTNRYRYYYYVIIYRAVMEITVGVTLCFPSPNYS